MATHHAFTAYSKNKNLSLLRNEDIERYISHRTKLSMDKSKKILDIVIDAFVEGLSKNDGVLITNFGGIVKQATTRSINSLTPELSKAIIDQKYTYLEAKKLGIPRKITFQQLRFFAHKKLKDKMKEIDKTTNI